MHYIEMKGNQYNTLMTPMKKNLKLVTVYAQPHLEPLCLTILKSLQVVEQKSAYSTEIYCYFTFDGHDHTRSKMFRVLENNLC